MELDSKPKIAPPRKFQRGLAALVLSDALPGLPLHASVYHSMRQIIGDGHFAPGEKLPIRAVAQRLGVSMTPVREATWRLVAEGALQVEHNKSVRVPNITAERLNEIWAIRKCLEGLAAATASQEISARGILELEEVQARIISARRLDDPFSVMVLNREFHFRLYARSGMPTLVRLIENLWLTAGPQIRMIFQSGKAKLMKGNALHIRIIEALRRHSPEDSRRAVELDIEGSRGVLLDLIAAGRHAARSSRIAISSEV